MRASAQTGLVTGFLGKRDTNHDVKSSHTHVDFLQASGNLSAFTVQSDMAPDVRLFAGHKFS